MKQALIQTVEPTLTVAHKAELNQQMKTQIAILMTPPQILDMVADLYFALQDTPRLVAKSEYNNWIDIYNIKRGAVILQRIE